VNDELDRLELELAELAPRRPSPELAQRIAAELAEASPRPRPQQRRAGLALIAAGAIAASAGAAIWFWPRGNDVVEVESPHAPGRLLLSATFDPALPSVWSFRHAASRSPAELDALLDQHTGRATAARTEFVQTRGFGVSETELHDLFGEL
jgi:hypothetical protein